MLSCQRVTTNITDYHSNCTCVCYVHMAESHKKIYVFFSYRIRLWNMYNTSSTVMAIYVWHIVLEFLRRKLMCWLTGTFGRLHARSLPLMIPRDFAPRGNGTEILVKGRCSDAIKTHNSISAMQMACHTGANYYNAIVTKHIISKCICIHISIIGYM